ncbi:non-ribosomal peptide synthetase [Herbidospora mongoliensis]|uniref:non-ribosomal peptide synthetase n=1 Tax=Herbidospora mongoliensis TaxID=688067 RepID=UPI00082FD760|nr:non-ribosomal peptide synthetase [Herbidospora mongoliensis]
MARALSPGQERLWFLHQLDPADPSYTTCHAYRLRGPLDPARLARAFETAASRQESLRTRFPTAAAEVLPPGPVPMTQVTAADTDEAQEVVRELANSPMDLSQPPIKVVLIRLAADDHVLAIALHHIIADGLSVGILARELADAYSGSGALPPPNPQVAGAAETDAGWWVERLRGVPVLDLPTDLPRPARRSGLGGEVVVTIDAATSAKAAETARNMRATPFMLYLTAFAVFLSRHSGQDDFCVGTPVSRRDDVRQENVIGHLTSMLPLRLTPAGTFAEAVKATRRTVIEAMSHADVPLEKVIADLGLPRDLSRTPVFQTMFALHSYTADAIASPLPGLDAEAFATGYTGARCDLSLDLWPHSDGSMTGSLIYSDELFTEATAGNMGARFLTLLDALLDDPTQPLDTADLLPAGERAWLTEQGAGAPGYEVATWTSLFVEQAARTPDALAVDDVTYDELLRWAKSVAASLPPAALVAIRTSRGVQTIVAMLAAHFAGAAYLPVDPAYPQARVEYILKDSGAEVVLRDEDLVVPESEFTPTSPDTFAYILYTSGSTGRPKGVVVSHPALANLLLGMRDIVGSTPHDVWLALTSTAFDISAVELFLPLITGGRVVFAEDARDAQVVADLIRDNGVTHVQATPSGWRVLLTADFPPVTAITAGEPLPPKLARELTGRTRRLINGYGPTETTIYSTTWDVPRDAEAISIGRPTPGTVIRVVAGNGDLAPIGVPGELRIGGLGLALGYHDRPDLTAEKFTPDGFYRTGDLVRMLGDGTLEFLGRTDNQVKLRGHRIELGEIETVLESIDGVGQAVVALQDDTIVAFVTGDDANVRDETRRVLPAYMVPSRVVVLDALPLTPNGKVDRKALPKAEVTTAPSRMLKSRSERLVAKVFSDVLKTAMPGADDDFFALGGHSLLATRVIARLPVRLPVSAVFLHPTVAGLAAQVDGARPPVEHVPSPRPAGTTPPLSAGQERLWFLNRLHPDTDAGFNMWLVRHLDGELDRSRLQDALTTVASRHEILRTAFPAVDGEPVVEIQDVTPVIEWITADDAARPVADRVNTPFDLTAGPAIRVTVAEVPDGHVLCVVAHHITGDGVSLNILLDELADAYSGVELPPVPLQFGDVAVWQRARDSGKAVDYWRRQLAEPTPLDLHPDRPRTGGAGPSALVTFRLSLAETERLITLARDNRVTLFMALLAAYQTTLARHTGRTDILVGTSNAGRDTVALESVIGYLTDILVLRGDLSGDPLFSEVLLKTRMAVLDAFQHRGVPFEKLVSELRLERDLTRTPVFQTMAILHTHETGRVPRPFAGLTVTDLPSGHAQAKFDLLLEAWQDPEGLHVQLEYDTLLYDASTARGLAARLETLLRGVIADPARRLSELPLLTSADGEFLDQVMHGPALPDPERVPAMIARQIAERPDAVAIRTDGRTVAYGELPIAVHAPGRTIREVGLDRTPEGIGALLGAWASGAAYLPIDPALPESRKAFLREEAAGGSHEDAAYVLFTSGSTGMPKGVVVGHQALAARVAWMREAYELTPDDHVVQFAAYSFDTHAEEIYPALAAGATLELLPDGPLTLPSFLASPRGRDVTVLDLPTAYFHELVTLDVDMPPRLRLVILGGEELSGAAVARWRARFGDSVRLVNTYGPTEGTIIATAGDVTGEERPPIGRPVGGVIALVLDGHGHPVPPGMPGELCLGGSGLADGYLNRPSLTAERFQPTPHGRVYRTGDRARFLADGRLEFLGRVDDQVKVRGHRVEPAEVELRLAAHPSVTGAVVIADEGRLVAYLTGTRTDLAEWVGGALPSYMIPSVWMWLDALPLTPHGKVDRRGLPAPDAGASLGHVEPRGDAETLVAEVYGEVLGLTGVGALDDFFAIGGHSLLAARALARIRAMTGVEVPIRVIFDAPTVEQLAAAVEDLIVAELDELSDEEAAALVHGRPQ